MESKEWKPIETAPLDGSPVLVAWSTGSMFVAFYDRQEDEWVTGSEDDERALGTPPKHWMSLPDLP